MIHSLAGVRMLRPPEEHDTTATHRHPLVGGAV